MATDGNANAAALGAFEREYQTSKGMVIGGLIFGIACLLFGVLCLALTVFGLDATATSTGNKIGGIIGAIFFFILGGFLIWCYISFRHSGVKVYANGLFVTQRGREQIFPWDEISALYVDVVVRVINGRESTGRIYTIHKFNGEKVRLTTIIKQVEEIAQRVGTETYQRMFPGWLAGLQKDAYPDGLAFEPFRLRRDVLLQGNESLPVAQIGSVEINDGKILVSPRDAGIPWAKVPYNKVPNAAIFLSLLEALRAS